jgi:hypothetical protein
MPTKGTWVAVAALALSSLACGSGSGATADGSMAPPDGAAGSGGSGGGGSGGGGGPVAITIVSPTSPAYTNKAVTIQVSVTDTGGASHDVRLLKNGTMLADLGAPPYSYDWDTTREAEASYQIVAQTTAGGQTIASAPVTVVVDRTPPTIVSKTPDSGASNVTLTDPIQIVFSEPLAPDSVAGGAVALALAGAPAGATVSLGADGKTVTVALADRSALALPGSMTEIVSTSITDLAGNAFGGAMWSYAVPLWVDLGTVAGIGPQMVLDAAGEPTVVTWIQSTSTLQIARHTGGTNWDMSVPSPQTQGQGAGLFGFGSSPAGLFLAWTEYGGSSTPIHVARWTGTAWDASYGTLLTTLGSSATSPAIAFTAAGQPVVHWDESSGGTNHRGHVSRWTGNGWSAYADITSGPCDMSPCRIAVDSSDFPIVETNLRLSRWTGSAWTPPPGQGGGNGLALDSVGQALAFRVGSTVEVIGVSPAGVASTYVPALNAAPMATVFDQEGQIAVAQGDRPVVAWFQYDGTSTTDPTTSDVHVAAWTGTRWDEGYGVFHAANGNCALALVENTIPLVAWQDIDGKSTHVSKSNH